MEQTLYLKLLGDFSAEFGALPLSFAARRAEAMLAYLAVTARPHAREKLATLLWDDRSQTQALANLRSLLAQLPKEIKPFLEINRQSVALAAGSSIWLDTAAFTAALESAEKEVLTEKSVEKIEAALRLYRGDFLEGVLVRESRGLEEWFAITAERFQRMALIARHKLAAYHLHRRRYDQGIQHATALVRMDPLQESNHRLLMLLLVRSGQRNAALRQYKNCASILMEELGIEPSAETTALYERIRHARTPPPHVVPVQFTPFIGRQAALADLNEKLDNPDCRLITLTGTGGVGKTRLSIQAADIHKGGYLHGIFFIPLAGTDTAAQLPLSIARVLGFTFQDKSDPQEQLLNYLRQRELLLILDNFEHIVEEGVALIQAVLNEAPLVKLIISSRERLNLRAEWIQTVSGLSHPSEANGPPVPEAFEALTLFQSCASRHQPAFAFEGENLAAAVRICQLLEGLPLGIELVAASLAAHPIHQVEAELAHNLDFVASQMRDLPQRHRSLRAVFQHSWDTLEEREKGIYGRLTLFQGGFSGEAAQAVAGATTADLAALINKSLLRLTQSNQYDLHQVLSQYAAEQLAAYPDAIEDGRSRHCHYYMNLLAGSNDDLTSSEATETLALLNKDIENIRLGWGWAIEKRLVEALELGMKGLYLFYILRGPFQEGHLLFDAAVNRLKNGQSSNSAPILAHLYTFLARFNYELAEYTQSAETARNAVLLSQETGQTVIEAEAEQLMGRALWRMGDYETTEKHFQKSLSLAREAEVRQVEAGALRGLGILEAHQGNVDSAITTYQDALTLYRAIQDRSGEATTLNNLGNLMDDAGDYTGAQTYLEQALSLHHQLGDRKGAGNSLNNLGVVFRHQANHSRAADCYTKALETFRELGDRWREGLALINLSNIAIDQGDFSKAINLLPQALALFQEISDPFGFGNSLALSGKVYLQLGRFSLAMDYFEKALAKFEESGHTYSQGLCLAYLSLASTYRGDFDGGLAYGRKAIETGEAINNRPVLGTAYANLGLAHLFCGNPEESLTAYRQSCEIRSAIGEALLRIEVTAGQILALLALGKTAEALAHTEQILDFLNHNSSPLKESNNHPLTGVENPFFIYIACYKALKTGKDERADSILNSAHILLQHRAGRILDETLRRPFLQNVPFNREILSLYKNGRLP